MFTQESGTASKRTPCFHMAYRCLKRMETEHPGVVIVSQTPFIDVQVKERHIICYHNHVTGLQCLAVVHGLHILNAEIESARDALLLGWYQRGDLEDVESWSVDTLDLVERSSAFTRSTVM